MSDDVVPRTPLDAPLLSWDHVMADSAVGLVDLDGFGTSALMNDTARELLEILRTAARGGVPDPNAIVGQQVAPFEAADASGEVDLGPIEPPERPAPRRTAYQRGPLTIRGDVTELLWRYAPVLAETIRREGRAGTDQPPAGPVGAMAPSRVVSCASSEGQRWIRIDGYRRSGGRFLVTLTDVTAIERDEEQEDALDWELADTVAQRLVTAETALDLGRDELGRRLIAEARALIRTRIGEHVRRSGGAGPGLMRRQFTPPENPPPPTGGAGT